MARKVFHRINEVPRMIIRNNSKYGPKHLKNPVVWIFSKASITPDFCGAADYIEKIKELTKNSEKYHGINSPLFWSYRTDLVSFDVRVKMCSESAKHNRYSDFLKKCGIKPIV